MKKQKIVFGVLLCLFIFMFAGCVSDIIEATQKPLVPIEKQYPERWEKTKVGMTYEEFKKVWTNARYADRQYQQDGMETYYVMEIKKGLLTQIGDPEFFFFKDNKLVKWRS